MIRLVSLSSTTRTVSLVDSSLLTEGATGFAAVLVRVKAGSFAACSAALGLYFTTLALNLAWNWMFFEFRQWMLAFIVLAVLWVLILVTLRAFWKHSTTAVILMLPYLIWVSFAGYLNGSILFLS